MNLIYFTQDAYKSVKKDIQKNADKYYQDEPWLEDYFEESGIQEFYRTSTIKVGDFSFKIVSNQSTLNNPFPLSNFTVLRMNHLASV